MGFKRLFRRRKWRGGGLVFRRSNGRIESQSFVLLGGRRIHVCDKGQQQQQQQKTTQQQETLPLVNQALPRPGEPSVAKLVEIDVN